MTISVIEGKLSVSSRTDQLNEFILRQFEFNEHTPIKTHQNSIMGSFKPFLLIIQNVL